MSLTYHITNRTKIYDALLSVVNIDQCNALIQHQSAQLSRIVHRPTQGTNFPLAGMSVIYAVQDYIGGADLWGQTVAGKRYPYPDKIPTPARWVAMGMMDAAIQSGQLQLPPVLGPTVEDVGAIAASIPSVIGRPTGEIHINPTFSGSLEVGGADANMIIGNTLWDIRTTAKQNPLDLDTILQQVGYYLLDYEDDYGIRNITWYYTRQQCLFTHPVKDLVRPNAQLECGDLLMEVAYS